MKDFESGMTQVSQMITVVMFKEDSSVSQCSGLVVLFHGVFKVDSESLVSTAVEGYGLDVEKALLKCSAKASPSNG